LAAAAALAVVVLTLWSNAEVRLDDVKIRITWKHKIMKSNDMSRNFDGL
jgi:hypothetical protein